MFYHLFKYLDNVCDIPGSGMFQYISFRAAIANILALLIIIFFGKRIIGALRRHQIGETVRDLGLQGQLEKRGTPTMGGVLILLAITVPMLLVGRLDNVYVQLMIVSTLWCGAIGFLDDYIKVFRHNKEGLKGRFKIVGQVGLGIIVGSVMCFSENIVVREHTTVPVQQQTVDTATGEQVLTTVQQIRLDDRSEKTTKTTIPFVKDNEFDYSWVVGGNEMLAWILYVVVAIFIVTAVSNGANLTDGLDGLLTGVSAPIVAVLGVLAYLSGHIVYADYLNIMYIPDSGELVVFAAAMVGALIGFMWYNSFPAQIFMGDTGSLAIGGIIAVFALCIRKELLLPIMCGVFLAESVSVMVQVGYFKYTNFLIDIANQMFGQGFMQFQNIFLPVGISFFVFQSMSYTIDIYRGQLKPLSNWLDYLFYLSFFPQLVAGPIVRAKDFIPQIRQNPLRVTREMFGTGIFLILSGLFKKAIISDYISLNFVDRIFDEPLLYSGFECLAGIYGYALQIYCDFSGYSDMAIGIALLLGFRFPKNFDAPYKSATITEFWRRWHISLSTWLRDYLYISLGGNRKGKLRTYGNLLITMLLGGLWHGAAVRFILWGALHGAALALHKLWMAVVPGAKATGDRMHWWSRAAGIFFTFNLVCLGWLMFRAESMQTVELMLHQIFYNFNAAMIPQVVSGYAGAFALIAAGFLLHLMPGRADRFAQRLVSHAPLVLQIVMAAAMIWCVMQVKSSDIQPFIYFQF